MWKFFAPKTCPAKSSEVEMSGVSIVLLQKRFESFSTERLTQAMERGWRRDPDPVKFFATSFGDGEGAVIKLNEMFITMRFFDRGLGTSELGEQELPLWALHRAHSSITYACPGEILAGELRDQFYGLLGLLCAELIDDNVAGLFFPEEQVFLRSQASLVQELRSGNNVSPTRLVTTLL